MSETFQRVDSQDNATDVTDPKPLDDVQVAEIPGADPSKFVTLTLAHPLNDDARAYLGLRGGHGSTEVGQKVSVNRNGAKTLISAGYATVDPEDRVAVRDVLRSDAAAGTTSTSAPAVEPATGGPSATPPATMPGQGETTADQPVSTDAESPTPASPSDESAVSTDSSTSTSTSSRRRGSSS